MKTLRAVFATDGVNRYGYRFAVRALGSGLWNECETGTPSYIAHDLTRPIGWSYPQTLFFESGLTRLIGIMSIADTDDEYRQVCNAISHFELNDPMLENDEDLASLSKQLQPYLLEEAIPMRAECVAYYQPNLALTVFPKLFDLADEDGLIPLNQLRPVGPGVFEINGLAVFAHQYFRRRLYHRNSLNEPFLARLQNMTSYKPRIALDPDMVGLASTYLERVELQYWWGPKFSDDLVNIPPGVTVYSSDETDRLFWDIERTEFWWQSRKGEHILEVEEIVDHPTSQTEYGCRYVHSIVEEHTREIMHFDGAVRGYSEEQIHHRRQIDIKHAERKTQYRKLWRIDGAISIDSWKSLLSDYFRDNSLVGEYLGASKIEEYEITQESDDAELKEQRPLLEFSPYTLNQGDGIRVAVSCFPLQQTIDTPRKVIALDRMTRGQATMKFVEHDILEVEKALRRSGENLEYEDNIEFVVFEDLYTNLPLIEHGQHDVSHNLEQTLTAIRQLVEGWHRLGSNRVLAYSIAYPLADREIRISIVGHVDDLMKWVLSPLAKPPLDKDQFLSWLDQVAEFLSTTYSELIDSPPQSAILKESGVLLLERVFIDDRFELKTSSTDNGIAVAVRVPEDKPALKSALLDGHLAIAPALILRESRCTRCSSSYRDCSCSRVLDQNVLHEIERIEPIGMFWTDRHAQLS